MQKIGGIADFAYMYSEKMRWRNFRMNGGSKDGIWGNGGR